MRPGQVLYEPGGELLYTYFPTSCIVSMLYLMENGGATEIAMIGNEGIVGIAMFMGGETMMNRAVVRSAGYAYRLRKDLFIQELNRVSERGYDRALQRVLFSYTLSLISQMAQTAACNRHHSVSQQLCRWLLQNLDRLPSSEIVVTQELIANMLGVRRESITETAGKLQQAGLIEYRRGHITVLDRSGLEALACECYQVVKAEFDRLLPPLRQEPSAAPIRTAPDREKHTAKVIHLSFEGSAKPKSGRIGTNSVSRTTAAKG